jgi:hypothetical protein
VKSSLSWLAGILIVGDEILSGKVQDSNITFLCRELHRIGWVVSKVRDAPHTTRGPLWEGQPSDAALWHRPP